MEKSFISLSYIFTGVKYKIPLLIRELTFLCPLQIVEMPITFFYVEKITKCGYSFFNWIVMNILVIKFSDCAKIFIFFTPAPVVSVLEDIHNATSS